MSALPDSNAQAQDLINQAKAAKRPLLLIFTGPDCKWCKKLKECLEDGVLQGYCAGKPIDFAWLEMGSKQDEESASCENGACRITTRNRFGIKSIPTAVLFDETGTVMGSTEFIDAVEVQGGQAYVAWVDQNLLFA